MKSFDISQEESRNALLIVGSPKTHKRTTSDVCGGYLLEKMQSHGWKTEKLTLKRGIDREKGQSELCAAIDRADLIILAFPLYVNSLPHLATKALEVIADHKKKTQAKRP